ncbi:hypothetical protein BCV69DRAFT_204300 [Microstroma glucosiphilum]|uniref:Zn(2)-C6 fungal-type domain-containing protein n=1 Tax=Pseudomicrostroma glucosiphilum TaxID=1684307 RepID=A0A316U7C8_9BASI|nr:hypothetical protein BCV69DRAFT_204300 [Pseudomicrostroma glucosiphilum]PWN20253.1 hypothetical protein BCV69DRAFT_204300 [Pseudomicrostroma glucosiphilum]
MPSHLPFAAGSAPSANGYSSSRSVSSSSAPSGPSTSYPSYSRPALLARQHPPTDYRGQASLAQPPPRDYTAPSHHYLSHTSAHGRHEAPPHHGGQGQSLPASSPSPSSSSDDSNNSSRDVGGNRAASGSRQGPSREGGGSSEGSSVIPSSSATVTHSGRKRKRLQRACVPCHKAKRRCDGGLPCSNCDFSGRSCSYADSHGNAVNPTARAKPPKRHDGHGQADGLDGDDRHSDTSRLGYSSCQHTSPSTAATSVSAPRLVLPDTDSHMSEHLKVYRASAPVNALLPKVFYGKQVPGTLLTLAISCFSSTRISGDISTGDAFAHSARKILIDEDASRQTIYERPTVDVVLTVLLLTMHEASTGKLPKAVSASTITINMIHDLRLHEAGVGAEHFHPAEVARMVCLAYVAELSVTTLAGKPSSLSDTDFLIATSRLAYVAGGDATSGAFLALLRSARVFAAVIDHQRRHRYRLLSADEINDSRRKDSLNIWADSLPPSLAFNDGNLAEVSRILSGHSQSQYSNEDESAWAWAWTMMHCFAEMSVFLLESLPSGSSQRRGAASANLCVLVEALDRATRSSVLSVLPLLFASQARPVAGVSNPASVYLADAQRSLCLIDDEQCRHALAYLGVEDPVVPANRPASAQSRGPTYHAPRNHSSSPSVPRLATLESLSSLPNPSSAGPLRSTSPVSPSVNLLPVSAGPHYTHGGYPPVLPPPPQLVVTDRKGGHLSHSDHRILPPLAALGPAGGVNGTLGSGRLGETMSSGKSWILK